MRVLTFALLLGSAAWLGGQSSSTTYVTDMNGHRVPYRERQVNDTSRSERVSDVNGRKVALESVEEKVVEKTDSRTVIERTVTRRSEDGRPLPPERVRIEESKLPGGAVSTTTSVFRGDLNGTLKLAERQTVEARTTGARTESETRIERPGMNGAVELVEKRTASSTHSDTAGESDLTTYRRDAGGRFVESAREVKKSTLRNGVPTTETVEYEAQNGGRMQATRQLVSETVKTPAGEKEVVNIFGPDSAGRISEGRFQLREQLIYDRTQQGGERTETFSVRRANISDPGRLGPAQKVSETVCKGKC
jgi:hypothetical protein